MNIMTSGLSVFKFFICTDYSIPSSHNGIMNNCFYTNFARFLLYFTNLFTAKQQQWYYLMYVKIEFSREHGPFSTQLKIRSWIMASRCSQVKLQLLNIVLSQDHQKVLSNHTFLINPSVSRHNVSWAIVWKCYYHKTKLSEQRTVIQTLFQRLNVNFWIWVQSYIWQCGQKVRYYNVVVLQDKQMYAANHSNVH